MKFSIEKESYWCSNGCDCCEPDEIIYYMPYHEDGEVVVSNGTCFSVDEAKTAILDWLEYKGVVEVEIEDDEG